tara:strand:- start:304 stop:825 length:522 start_codon:yes stop_codon:yes gene_type:complete
MPEYIDLRTGEIVKSTSRRKVKIASTRQAVGIDTKYPSECVTADSLLEALGNLDACLHFKPEIDHAYLMDSVMQKLLSVQEAQALILIGEGLVAWNYWIGTTADFHKVIPAANTGRTLKTLETKGALKVVHRDKPVRGSLVVRVNPTIAFLGANYFREGCTQDWYSRVGILDS